MKKKYFLINSLNTGGAERQATLILNNIEFEKIFLIEDRVDFDLTKKLKIDVIGQSFYSLFGPISKLLSLPLISAKLSKNIERNSIVLSFLEMSNYVNIVSSILFKKHQAIISLRTIPSMQYSSGFGFIHRFLIRTLYHRAEKVLCNTQGAKKDLFQNYGVKNSQIEVIPNGYEIATIENLAQEPTGIDLVFKTVKTLCYVARLTPGKGHIELLSILKALKDKGAKLCLILLGSGPTKRLILKEAKRLSLEVTESTLNFSESGIPDVILLNFQKNPYKFVSKATVFISPSKWEGLPNAIIEALICNTLVVSSDCPSGPKEVLLPKNRRPAGALLTTFSTEGPATKRQINLWADKIISLLDNPAECQALTQAGKSRSLDFSKDSVIREWNKYLTQSDSPPP